MLMTLARLGYWSRMLVESDSDNNQHQEQSKDWKDQGRRQDQGWKEGKDPRFCKARHILTDVTTPFLTQPPKSNAPSASYVLSDGDHLEKAIAHFKQHDPKLASYLNEDTIENFRKRIARKRGVDPFRTLASGIIYQQIHGKAAASIEARFIKLFDSTSDTPRYPSPDDVLSKSIEELKSAGLSARKVIICCVF